MAVKELTIKALKHLIAQRPDDMAVLLSRDVEGNEFSPLGGYSTGTYIPDPQPWRPGRLYEEGEAIPNHQEAKKAFVLWPMH